MHGRRMSTDDATINAVTGQQEAKEEGEVSDEERMRNDDQGHQDAGRRNNNASSRSASRARGQREVTSGDEQKHDGGQGHQDGGRRRNNANSRSASRARGQREASDEERKRNDDQGHQGTGRRRNNTGSRSASRAREQHESEAELQRQVEELKRRLDDRRQTENITDVLATLMRQQDQSTPSSSQFTKLADAIAGRSVRDRIKKCSSGATTLDRARLCYDANKLREGKEYNECWKALLEKGHSLITDDMRSLTGGHTVATVNRTVWRQVARYLHSKRR